MGDNSELDEWNKRKAKVYQRDVFIAIENEVTPATALQGHLSSRWKRRDGDIYLPARALWVDLIPDEDFGWRNNTIRARLMRLGQTLTLQVIGNIDAPLPGQQRWCVGFLPDGYAPSIPYSTIGALFIGATYGTADWEILPDGSLWTVWSLGNGVTVATGSINAVVPMG